MDRDCDAAPARDRGDAERGKDPTCANGACVSRTLCGRLGFPFAEVSNNGSLVYPGATAINPMTTEAGFSVFLAGAALACLASTLLVVVSLRRDDRGQARNHPDPGALGVPLVP
jgi:hypothetical protein